MYIRFLNKEVQKEVEANPVLKFAWYLKYPPYDSDIDPVHNIDWVRSAEKLEEEQLCEVKKLHHKLIMKDTVRDTMKWSEVGNLSRIDIITELEELAADAENTAHNSGLGPSESYAWLYHADAIRAAIEKLKEK